MLKSSKIALTVLLAFGASAVAAAQKNKPAAPDDPTPALRFSVISRTTPAVNYGHRGSSTKINFKRVEWVVSGEGIGSQIGKPVAEPVAGLSPR